MTIFPVLYLLHRLLINCGRPNRVPNISIYLLRKEWALCVYAPNLMPGQWWRASWCCSDVTANENEHIEFKWVCMCVGGVGEWVHFQCYNWRQLEFVLNYDEEWNGNVLHQNTSADYDISMLGQVKYIMFLVSNTTYFRAAIVLLFMKCTNIYYTGCEIPTSPLSRHL